MHVDCLIEHINVARWLNVVSHIVNAEEPLYYLPDEVTGIVKTGELLLLAADDDVSVNNLIIASNVSFDA